MWTANLRTNTIQYNTKKICIVHNVCQLAESELWAVAGGVHLMGVNAIYLSLGPEDQVSILAL